MHYIDIKGNLVFVFIVPLYSRMYQFIGDASGTDSLDFQPLFADYEYNPGTGSKHIIYSIYFLLCIIRSLLGDKLLIIYNVAFIFHSL